jgi:hypothetical protein
VKKRCPPDAFVAIEFDLNPRENDRKILRELEQHLRAGSEIPEWLRSEGAEAIKYTLGDLYNDAPAANRPSKLGARNQAIAAYFQATRLLRAGLKDKQIAGAVTEHFASRGIALKDETVLKYAREHAAEAAEFVRSFLEPNEAEYTRDSLLEAIRDLASRQARRFNQLALTD